MTAKEIVSLIEEVAPNSIQESWDNSGFSVGDPDREVSSVLLALDCTPEVIEEAISIGAQMIITHHPLIFKGVKKITNSTLLERMITRIIKNDLIIYSVHTNIDKVISGVSGLMAEKLGLLDITFLKKDVAGDFGLGLVGNLPVPMSAEEILVLIKERFNLNLIKHSKPIDTLISRIALCGGSGSSLINIARESGAQLYITGDITYHDFFCEPNFMIMDIGHHESEIGILDMIKTILIKKMSTFAVRIAVNNINPIHYY